MNYLNTVQLGQVLQSFNGYLDTLKTMEPMANGLEVNYTQRPEIIRMFRTYLGPQFNSFAESEQKLFLHDLFLITRLDKVLFREFAEVNNEKPEVLEALTIDFLLMFPRRSLVVFEGDAYHLDYDLLPTTTPSIQHEQLLTNVRFAAIAKDTDVSAVDPLGATLEVAEKTDDFSSPSINIPSLGYTPRSSVIDLNFAREQEQLAGSSLPNFLPTTPSTAEPEAESKTTITTNQDGSYTSGSEFTEIQEPSKIVTKKAVMKEGKMNVKTQEPSIPPEQPDSVASDFAFNQKRKSESRAKRRQSVPSSGQQKKKRSMKGWASAAVVSAISTAIGVPSLVTILNSVN